ncbi:hypothetical protein [Streptomyces sp. NPDC001137]|uniref:hypothetical protein n=1 Tax=Streptomyces sp. NPDC001137 TaxID=3154378 RepID=UPI00332E898D
MSFGASGDNREGEATGGDDEAAGQGSADARSQHLQPVGKRGRLLGERFVDKMLFLVAAGTEHQRFGGTLDRLESELGELTCPGFGD